MRKIPMMAIGRLALVFALQLCTLFISQISAEQDFPPRLTHQPHSVQIKLDDPQAIECPIESEPASEVKWFKDGKVLASEPAHLELMGAELMFTKFNQDDVGEYHCEAQNYLGVVASDRFRLTVQSTVQVESVLLEPQVYSAVEQQDWPAEFHCIIPTSLLNRLSKTWRTTTASQPEQFVRWHRNGRPLSVVWDDNNQPQLQRRRSFRASQSETNSNEFVLSILRPSYSLDNNSTFTCRLKWNADDQFGELTYSGDSNELHESRPALLRIEPAKRPIIMDIPMGPPMGNISDSPKPAGGTNWNHSTQFGGTGDGDEPALAPAGGKDANNRIRQSLAETLSDLYQIAKPTLILFGIMCLVAVIVLFQFLFVKRRAEANRYMKHGHHLHHHHQYSSSGSSANSQTGNCGGGGGGGSGASSALGDAYDPVLASLLARTLSAPSASSLSGAAKKYNYYRGHMRGKVAAAVTSDHQLVPDGNHQDFISPYAVSSICLNQQHPPPVTSEAMRALNEQFDINQLVMIDKESQQQASNQHTDSVLRMPFNLLLPPPSPPLSMLDCDQTLDSAGDRSTRTSTVRIRTRR